MKKKLLIVLLFAMLFCLSACQKEVILPDNFYINDYSDELEIITNVFGADDQSLEIFAHDADDFVSSEKLGFDVEIYKDLCSGTITARQEAGNPVALTGEMLYEVSGIHKDIVTVIIPVEYENYTVHYEITFEPNAKSEYNPFEKPYNLTQIVVSTQYSKAELMKMAGMNTLMGMGVVFLVLIFISFIISLFKYLPGSGAKKQQQASKKEEQKPAAASNAVPTTAAPTVTSAASENLMDNQELVAVITAAILAANGSASNMVSSDKLIVRSIKRASR